MLIVDRVRFIRDNLKFSSNRIGFFMFNVNYALDKDTFKLYYKSGQKTGLFTLKNQNFDLYSKSDILRYGFKYVLDLSFLKNGFNYCNIVNCCFEPNKKKCNYEFKFYNLSGNSHYKHILYCNGKNTGIWIVTNRDRNHKIFSVLFDNNLEKYIGGYKRYYRHWTYYKQKVIDYYESNYLKYDYVSYFELFVSCVQKFFPKTPVNTSSCCLLNCN